MSYVSVNSLLDFVLTLHCQHVCGMTADCDPQQKQAMQRLFCQTVTDALGCLTAVVHALKLSHTLQLKTCSASLICLAIQVWLIVIGNNALHCTCSVGQEMH